MNGVTTAERMALLAKPELPSVEFYSRTLATVVTATLDGDFEPLHYQFGVVGADVYLVHLMHHGCDWVEHLTEATQALLCGEALKALQEDA